jgi:hypothetical protein
MGSPLIEDAFAAGALQSSGQLESSMKSAMNRVNGLPTGAHDPANIAAFKEG